MIEVARGRLSKQIARDIGIAKGTAPARNCTAELEKASRFATLTPAGRGGRRVKSCHSDESFQLGGNHVLEARRERWCYIAIAPAGAQSLG
jgi:hypothetical protein